MKVTYRPAIAVDLAEIGAYIARDNPARAATFVTSLVARCEKIGQNPSGGRLRPEIAEEIRSVAFRGYVIFYRIETGHVRIVRVVHGARDLERLSM